MESITKAGLIYTVADESNQSQVIVKKILAAAAKAITGYTQNGYAVPFMGIGKFFPHDVPEHMGRNPKTGELIRIPAKRVLKFKASTTVDINPTEMQRRIEELR